MKTRHIIILGIMAVSALACKKSDPEFDGHQYVDMGLSVKWATCNVGAVSATESGDFFAWGETEPYYVLGQAASNFPAMKPGKEKGYDWPSYKWSNNDGTSFTKYVADPARGTVDGKTVLEPADDPARANWGSHWHTPTLEEWKELRDNCSWTWTKEGSVTGYRVTSKTTGGSIFIPATGHAYHTQIYNAATGPDYADSGFYWSSTLVENTEQAHGWQVASTVSGNTTQNRFLGCIVRPVAK